MLIVVLNFQDLFTKYLLWPSPCEFSSIYMRFVRVLARQIGAVSYENKIILIIFPHEDNFQRLDFVTV